MGDLGRGELVRLEDRHHPVHARLSLEPQALDAGILLDVADRTDHGHPRTAAAMGDRARALDLLDDRIHLLLGGGLLHHNHHLFILSATPGSYFLISPAVSGGCPACVRLARPRSGLASRGSEPRWEGARPLERDPVRTDGAAHGRTQAEAPS